MKASLPAVQAAQILAGLAAGLPVYSPGGALLLNRGVENPFGEMMFPASTNPPALGSGAAGASSVMPAWYGNATPAPLLGTQDANFAAQPAGVRGAVNPWLLALFADAAKDTDLSALAAVPAE